MNVVLKIMNFVFKIMNFVLNIMNFVEVLGDTYVSDAVSALYIHAGD